ncbi:MAG: response regulator [Desulfosalsimonas sp.]
MSHIMVLDDVEDAGAMIKRILERRGHSVAVFTEEEDALDHARTKEVDLAILDIKLKKMSGVQLLKQIKEARPDIDVVMLTGYPTLETAREAMGYGAREYLVKPIDKNELEEKIENILENRDFTDG